ncbi:MAG: hypothetical protein GX568_04990 [Candidatus Gastranaerophilales bacterium]|nr:hypothetical protein [Candidatus Gastranaerophilales bacterium]
MTDVTIAPNGVNGLNGLGLNMSEMDFMQDISAYDNLSIFDWSIPNSEMNAFGVLGLMMNPRHVDAVTGQAEVDFHKYDTADILNEDIQTLKPMAETLHRYRDPVWGKRIIEKDRVGKLLDIENDKAGNHKVAALYKLYCAMYGGLKDKNAPITFENLLDPGLLVRQSQRFFAIRASSKRSKDIEKLTRVAVEGYNPELAAVLLKEMGEGIGVDDKTVRAILVDSKKKMDDATHKRFITEIDAAYQKLTGGETLDDYIYKQYPYVIFGKVIKSSKLGSNETGKEYLAMIDEARQKTHHVSNPGNIWGAIGSPLGLAF